MINHALRCIYVHIPKTAGNSVNRAFGIGWEDHKDLQRYAADLTPEQFEGYYKFAVVRNPWERIFSDYNYQKKKSRARNSKLFLYKESGERRTFGEWVRAALADPHRHAPSTWGGDVSAGIHRLSPQVDWITVNGRGPLDFVVRMEHLQSGFDQVCRDLGIPAVHLPHRNRRLHAHYSWYYDTPTRDLVGSYYARDVAAFGYQFETSPSQRVLQHSHWLAASLLLALKIPVTLTSIRVR